MGKSSGSIWVSLGLKTAEFQKGIKKAKKESKGFSKGFKDIAKLAAGAFAVTEIVSFGKEALALAGRLEGVKVAFDRLDDPSLLKTLRAATKGTVSDLKLMQNAVKAKNLGLPVKQLGTFFEFARRRAKETGESVEFLTESIVNGIGRKSPLILDNLGISATALKEEFKATGDFGKAAANIIEREMANMAPDIDTAAETTARLSAQLENVKASAGKLGTEGLQALTPFLDGLLTGVKNIDLIWKDTFQGLGEFTNEELSRTLDGGWATEAGVNISKITEAFDKIPLDKIKGNVGEVQKEWIKLLGEDSQDAMILFNQYIADRIELEGKLSKSTSKAVNEVVELTKAQKDAALKARNLTLNLEALKDVKLGDFNKKSLDAFKTLKDSMPDKPVKLHIPVTVIPEVTIPEEGKEKITGGMIKLGEEASKALASSLQTGAADILGGMAQVVGEGGGFDEMKNVLIGGFAGILQMFGQQLIALGIAEAALGEALAAGPLGAPLAIGAGVALIAIASAIKGSLSESGSTPFAEGGVVTGSVFANIGEGRGTTKSNPEIVAPLDKLKSFMPNGDGMGGNVEFEIKGTSLVGILKRTGKVSSFSN